MRPRLLVTERDRFSAEAARSLREVADVTLADLDRPSLLEKVSNVEVLWIRLRHRIDQEILDRAANLRFICSPTTGLNHIDLEGAGRRDIRVISLRGELDFLKEIRATAEHTIALMLALLRNLCPAANHVLAGGWDRDTFRGHELHEKTIGVVGYGRLGRLVAKYLEAFGARVLVTDPNVATDEVAENADWTSLGSLLAESDVVTLHVNLCDETKGFFGREQFDQMRCGAYLVNTSRGELVDESALLDSLASGRLAGAALDVLCDEDSSGMGDHPLVSWALGGGNLLITPHIGGCTTESMAKTELFLAKKLCAVLQESSVSA
jgi:D-3-phosphoglycerate dehydrogenase